LPESSNQITLFSDKFKYTTVGQLAYMAILQTEYHRVFVATARNQLIETVQGRCGQQYLVTFVDILSVAKIAWIDAQSK
jgi:hypothetical protein